AQLLKPFGEAVEIVVERAEREMSEPFARALAHCDPHVRIATGFHGQKTAVLIDLESEFAVEIFGDREIWNGEMKPVDRMNAEFAWTSRRLDGVANGGHRVSSPLRAGAESESSLARRRSADATSSSARRPSSARAGVARRYRRRRVDRSDGHRRRR